MGDLADEGQFLTVPDNRSSTGRKATSVMTESIRLTPSPSTVVEKRMVSSWTRCEAPSIRRNSSQLAM
jgi:hypothetical protein